MGQIVGGAAKPKRCNINKLSQLGTPAAGEYILVSSDNSMNAAGQGNFDCYIEGDGRKAAYLLKLNRIANNKILVAEKTGANIAGLGWTSVNRYYYGITNDGIIDYHTNNSYHVIRCVTSQLFKKGDIIHFERQATVARVTIFAFSHTNLSTGDIEGVQVDIASNVTSTEHNYDVVCPYDNAYLLIYVYDDPKWIADTRLFDFMQFADVTDCVLKVEQSLSSSEQKQARKNLGLGNGNVDEAPNLLSSNVVKSSGIANAIDNIIGREANYVDGRYILSTGSTAANSDWMYTSEYIPVSVGDVIIWHPAVVKSDAAICLYNSSKSVINYWVASAVERTITLSTSGAAYVRASFAKANTSGVYLKINGADAWKPFEAITPLIPSVENSLDSSSASDALSANMGKELERNRNLRIVGNNTTLVKTIYNGVILPKHRYKLHLLNKDFDTSGDTLATEHTRFGIRYKFASADPVTLYDIMSTATLKDVYDFSIPDGESDAALYLSVRATSGEVVRFVLEDVTDSNTSNFANTYIAGKCSTFKGLFSAAGASTLAFLYFTDPHLMGTNGTFDAGKYKEWMGIIENYYHNIPTDFCFCGGDLLNSGDTPAQACDKLGYVDGTSRKSLYPYHFMLGNHDTNYQGTEELPQDAIDAILFREEGKAYYRFDTDNCTCFVFDTGKDNDHSQSAYRIAQYGFFKDGLLSNVKDNIVLFFHIYYYNSTNQAVMAKDIMDMAGAFNNRTSVTIAGTTYDFSAVTRGTIRFAIVGHSHFDFDVVDNGIPVIGTLNVQKNGENPSFDMVLADFSNNVINLVRVGQGSDRTIQM
jgi:hypothetical protein